MSLLEIIKKVLSSFRPLTLLYIHILLAISLVSSVVFVYEYNKSILVTVPAFGGEIKEGIVGSPRFINPVLALSTSDEDLTKLIYSGLLREDNDTGKIILDLAESYTESPDGLVYTFTLKDSISFHDGYPVTVDDIIYTINLTQDPSLKSPHKIEWEGVHLEKIDERTLSFTLKQKYPNFLKNLTIGILPKHLWSSLQPSYIPLSDYNLTPIGSGPYFIKEVKKDAGMPSVFYLESFKDFSLGSPYITKITLSVFGNQDELLKALRDKKITSAAGLNTAEAKEILDENSLQITRVTLPRVYAVFFNMGKKNITTAPRIREALSLSIDKNKLIEKAVFGFGTPLDSALPSSVYSSTSSLWLDSLNTESRDTQKEASLFLENLGYYKNPDGVLEKVSTSTIKKVVESKGKKTTVTSLSYATTTPDTTIDFVTTSSINEFKVAAEEISAVWESLGFKVNTKLYETGDLQTVIKNRNYDALLYGTVVQNDVDLYAFWHSSQRVGSGLNVSMYANSKIDKILNDLKNTSQDEEKDILYQKFIEEMNKDLPAAFLYSPQFIYVTDKDIRLTGLTHIKKPADRFNSVHTWHIKTESIWAFLVHNDFLKKYRN